MPAVNRLSKPLTLTHSHSLTYSLAAQGESLLEEMAGLPPQERITSVRPFWEGLSQEEREALLTVPVEELREYAQRTMARLRKQAGACSVCLCSVCRGVRVAAEGEPGRMQGGLALERSVA